MAAKVGERLKHEPMKLRFTTTAITKYVLKRASNQTIGQIVFLSYIHSSTTVTVLYEKLDVSIVDLETKRSLNVIWTGIHDKERSTYLLSLSKTSTVQDLIGELSKQVQLTPAGTGRIRVFTAVKDGKAQNEFTGSEMIGDIPDPVELFAEEIPREE